MTPKGYTSLGDISVGDSVYTKEGEKTRVIEVPFEGEEASYEVTFQDGTKVTASEGHKWVVGTSDWGKTQNKLRIKTTEELLDFKLTRGRNKYFVPLTKPIQFSGSRLPLDPYFVGCMLGDGCLTRRSNMTLTGIDLEMVDYFNLPEGYSAKRSKGTIQWKFTRGQYGGSKYKTSFIWDSFKKLGLKGVRSHTKFIPKSYLLSSVENRLLLLQGLLDTDGTVREAAPRRSPEIKFTTVSSQLKEDVVFLAESLGFRVTVYSDYQENEIFRVYLSGSSLCPFKLKRKVDRWKSHSTSKPIKYIVDIKYVGEKKVKCITVEDDSHTFLVNHCTVTKNSAGGGKSYAMVADPARYIFNPLFRGLLLRRTTEELRELIQISKTLYPKLDPKAQWVQRDKTWYFSSGATLWMSYLERDDDVSRYQGQAFTWIGFDELTQWPTPYAWNYMRSRLRGGGNLPKHMRASTNPGGVGHHWVKKMFIDPAKPNVSFDARDHETNEIMLWPKSSKHAVANNLVGKPMFRRKFIPARLFDNPYLTEDGMYEANLLSMPEHQRKQLLEGNWDVNEGAAFPEWNRNLHVVDSFIPEKNWTKFRACDYGYGSWSAVLWFAVEPSTEQLIVYRELFTQGVVAVDLADMILEAEEGDRIKYGVLDSSLWHNRGDTGPSLAEQMISRGCRWRPADRSKGSRVAGKNEIHRRLQVDEFTEQPRLVFMDNCLNMISQLPSVPLDKKNPDDVDTKYADDHGYDALRYGIMSRPRSNLWDFNSFSTDTYRPVDKIFGF